MSRLCEPRAWIRWWRCGTSKTRHIYFRVAQVVPVAACKCFNYASQSGDLAPVAPRRFPVEIEPASVLPSEDTKESSDAAFIHNLRRGPVVRTAARASSDRLRFPSGLAPQGRLDLLLSDAMEGRRSLERGSEVAIQWIASEFAKAGLKPLSGDSFLSRFPSSNSPPTAT